MKTTHSNNPTLVVAKLPKSHRLLLALENLKNYNKVEHASMKSSDINNCSDKYDKLLNRALDTVKVKIRTLKCRNYKRFYQNKPESPGCSSDHISQTDENIEKTESYRDHSCAEDDGTASDHIDSLEEGRCVDILDPPVESSGESVHDCTVAHNRAFPQEPATTPSQPSTPKVELSDRLSQISRKECDGCQLSLKLNEDTGDSSVTNMVNTLKLKVQGEIDMIIDHAIENNWIVVDHPEDPLANDSKIIEVPPATQTLPNSDGSPYATPTGRCTPLKDLYWSAFNSFESERCSIRCADTAGTISQGFDQYNGFYVIEAAREWTMNKDEIEIANDKIC